MKKHTIRSTELRDYDKKHEFEIVDIVGKNKLLILLQPPIPGHFYDQLNDIDKLVVAPRHKGVKIVPDFNELPCHVYMCLPEKDSDWFDGPYRIIDWGLIEKRTCKELDTF